MNVLKDLSNSLNSKNLGVALFAVTGACKICEDYKSAPENKKREVLKRDLTILAGTATGLAAYNFSKSAIIKSKPYSGIKNKLKNNFNKIIDSDFCKKFFKTSNEKTKNIAKNIAKESLETLKDCTDNLLMVSSGLIGAIGTSNIIKKIHKKNNKTESFPDVNIIMPETENNNLPVQNRKRVSNFEIFTNNLKNTSYNYVNEETQKSLFSNLTNMPEMKLFSNSMVGLQSFEVMQEKSFANQIKKATTNLITGTLVPVFYLSLATNMTKGLKNNILRFPFVFVSMAAATMYTNKKIGPKLEKNQFITKGA